MRSVWKYPLPFPPLDVFSLTMPDGAEVLHLETIAQLLYLWALVDSDRSSVERTFAVVGTGHPAPPAEEAAYVGTFFLLDGAFVGHLFEMR